MAPENLSRYVNPISRSRSENKERAFVAASRRKDRTLETRLESAQNASNVHKERTGKPYRITKEIVEKEAMYEEIDENYQEKLDRMLQAQSMCSDEENHSRLIASSLAHPEIPSLLGSAIACHRASGCHQYLVNDKALSHTRRDPSSLRDILSIDTYQGLHSGVLASASETDALGSLATFDTGNQSQLSHLALAHISLEVHSDLASSILPERYASACAAPKELEMTEISSAPPHCAMRQQSTDLNSFLTDSLELHPQHMQPSQADCPFSVRMHHCDEPTCFDLNVALPWQSTQTTSPVYVHNVW